MNLRCEFFGVFVKNSRKFSEFCYDFGKSVNFYQKIHKKFKERKENE